MNIFLALFFLGLVQGLTEFLPVSSSGHLVLFSKILGVEDSLFVSILLHVATLLSICVVFWRDIWQMLRHPFGRQTMLLAAATIPTCIVVLLILPIVKSSFSGGLLPVCFAASALLLFLAEIFANKKSGAKSRRRENKIFVQNESKKYWRHKIAKNVQQDITKSGLHESKIMGQKENNSGRQEITFKSAIFMGVAQGFAVFPGLSRSGTTISAGLLCGQQRAGVAKFSFLMSIPIVLLSLVMEIFEVCTGAQVVSVPAGAIALAFFVAFAVGILAIKLTIKITEKAGLKWFSLYLAIISIAALFILKRIF